MDSEILIDTWVILSQYIKDKQQAADHWINELIDLGIDDETLQELANADKYLGIAVDELLDGAVDEYEEEEENEGW
jgi:predicted nucleic acid-binding protein